MVQRRLKVLVSLHLKMAAKIFLFIIQKFKVAAITQHLNDGQAVEFEVGQGQKGPCANKVVAV